MRSAQLEVCVEQLRLVARLERELALFRAVPPAVGIEPQDLVHEILCLRQVPSGLEAGRRQVQLLDAPLPLARFDQRLAERLVPFGIIRVIGDPPLELLDRRLRRRRVAVGEHERTAFLLLTYQAVQAQVYRSRTAPAPAPRAHVVDRQGLIVDLVPPVGRAGVEVRLELERRHFHYGLAGRRARALRNDRFDLGRLGRLRTRPSKSRRRPDAGPLRHDRRHRRLDLDLRFQEWLELHPRIGGALLPRHGWLELPRGGDVIPGDFLLQRRRRPPRRPDLPQPPPPGPR